MALTSDQQWDYVVRGLSRISSWLTELNDDPALEPIPDNSYKQLSTFKDRIETVLNAQTVKRERKDK